MSASCPYFDALTRAEEAGLDLVEIAPQSVPPVCKILDFGRYKYQAQKKAAEARKNQKIVEIKEIKLRPNIDDHDYDVKMRQSRQFIDEGDKVKVTPALPWTRNGASGPRLSAAGSGERRDMADVTKVESEPRFEGKQMIMILTGR